MGLGYPVVSSDRGTVPAGIVAELSSSLSLRERSCTSHESDVTFLNISPARSPS